MTEEFTYADSGVDRDLRTESKKALRILQKTYKFSHMGKVVQLPYGNVFSTGSGRYLDLVIEGVGTKVLVAQLAKRYDTIGVDGVAMAVNDVIRSGAKPLAISDNIHAQISDPVLVQQLMKGIAKGALESRCVVPSGEIGDVGELIKGITEGTGFDIVVSSIGEVTEREMISGRNIKPGNVIIGLRSSGLHSNGISLARKVLFKQWGGKYDPHDTPEELSREIVDEVLEPTKIYAVPVLKIAEEVEVKAAVHITGDAYLKFARLAKFSRGVGFEFNNFDPQPIFGLVQRTARQLGGTITDDEMFRTFNMGWGFAVIVDASQADTAIDILKKTGAHANLIGVVRRSGGVRILYRNKRIILK